MPELHIIQKFIIWIPPVFLAITLHEVAHGWAAAWFGDPTARSRGRLSLNPLRHIDPIGTIVVPAMLFLAGGFLFGWAKPVPVDINRLRRPKQHMALVALAGPLSNLVMAVGWALVLSVAFALTDSARSIAIPLVHMGYAGVTINVLLAVLNLLPIPPLDGSKVLAGILPDWAAVHIYRLEIVGLVIVVGLLVSGVLGTVINGPITWVTNAILSVFLFS